MLSSSGASIQRRPWSRSRSSASASSATTGSRRRGSCRGRLSAAPQQPTRKWTDCSESYMLHMIYSVHHVRRDLIWEMREEWRWLINETWHVKYNFEFSDQAIWAFYSVIDPPKHSNPRKTYQRAATNMSWWNMQMLHLDQVLHFIPLPIQQFLWLTARKSRWWFMFMNIF